MIWTGDSARHDSDERTPRTEEEVVSSNEMMVRKFTEVFGKGDNDDDTDPTDEFLIPIIPTFGNNDIMPHNIFEPGPNKWTQKYASVWKSLIPEEQRHGFIRGGWFSVEVVPDRLAVFSLNTLYFFDSNTAVDGCADNSEPGYEQMDWLRIQLQFLRKRGMKAILTGHVPPARTKNKQSWDESCWQKYTLWMRQYRDVVVGSVYGHMNIDHFMLQDSKDIKKKVLKGRYSDASVQKSALDEETTISSSAEYLTDLRSGWARFPDPPKAKEKSRSGFGYFYEMIGSLTKKRKSKKSKDEKYLGEIGGEFAERYSVSLISPSVVPNYFPTMRVVEYNITGVQDVRFTSAPEHDLLPIQDAEDIPSDLDDSSDYESKKHKRKYKKPKHKKPKKPTFTIPSPPPKHAPPGPAYSPQPFSWTSYTQYYANLTHINDDFTSDDDDDDDNLETLRWKSGKHTGKRVKERSKKHHKKFAFEVEYDTKNESVFRLRDLSVRNWLDLATRIGQYKPRKDKDWLQPTSISEAGESESNVADLPKYEIEDGTSCDDDDDDDEENTAISISKNKKSRKHHGKRKPKHGRRHRHKRRKAINKVWFTFVDRAYVGTKDEEDLHQDFGH